MYICWASFMMTKAIMCWHVKISDVFFVIHNRQFSLTPYGWGCTLTHTCRLSSVRLQSIMQSKMAMCLLKVTQNDVTMQTLSTSDPQTLSAAGCNENRVNAKWVQTIQTILNAHNTRPKNQTQQVFPLPATISNEKWLWLKGNNLHIYKATK